MRKKWDLPPRRMADPFLKKFMCPVWEKRVMEKGRGKNKKREERENNQGFSQEKSQCCSCFMVCLFLCVPLL